MTIGPLEFKVMGFPGDNFTGEILPELKHLQLHGTIRVIDLVLITKDAAGEIATVDVSDLKAEASDRYGWFIGDLLGLLTPEEIARTVSAVPPNGSAALLLLEHRWAVRLQEALLRANGVLLSHDSITPETLERVAAELDRAQLPSR